jgi:polyisoprenoid-binding protein YceI
MKKQYYFAAAIVIMIASAFTAFQLSDLKIAENYSVKFDGGDPAGEFKGLKGIVRFDPGNLEASLFDVSIDVATINTGNGMKNTHAKSDKWLDAEKYPEIKFTSHSITKTANGFETKGILDMHGVQKEITIPFTFEDNVFKGGLEVNRLDFDINTAEPKHGAAVLKVDISVPVTK